jgi:hypothetical protein
MFQIGFAWCCQFMEKRIGAPPLPHRAGAMAQALLGRKDNSEAGSV